MEYTVKKAHKYCGLSGKWQNETKKSHKMRLLAQLTQRLEYTFK